LHELRSPHRFPGSHKGQDGLCYSEPERDNAVNRLRGKPEITRFKGLGKISPKEFAQFIGKEMLLSRVEHASKTEASGIHAFYMGKNTLERKDYIMEDLVVPVED
jgi:topoisomerase-4 subunit B